MTPNNTTPPVIEKEEESAITSTPEASRFVESYKVYLSGSPRISASLKIQQDVAAGDVAASAAKFTAAKSTDSASAAKTMGTRKAIHGQKGTTDAGVQSIKTAGKNRTQSTKTT